MLKNVLMDDLIFILQNESAFATQIQRQRENVSALIGKMESLKIELEERLHGDHIDPIELKNIVEQDSDVFKFEMSTNWWSFFHRQIMENPKYSI